MNRSIGTNPLAVEPLVVNPNCRGGAHDLLLSGGEINTVVAVVDLLGDLADPPAVVVKDVDMLGERKGGGGDTRRLGAELSRIQCFGEGLGAVVLEQRVVAYDVEAVVEARHDRGEVVGAEETLLGAADLDLVAVAEVDHLSR